MFVNFAYKLIIIYGKVREPSSMRLQQLAPSLTLVVSLSVSRHVPIDSYLSGASNFLHRFRENCYLISFRLILAVFPSTYKKHAMKRQKSVLVDIVVFFKQIVDLKCNLLFVSTVKSYLIFYLYSSATEALTNVSSLC